MRFDRDDFGSNVEDRGRGSGGGGFGFGGGGGGGGMLLGLIASRFGIVGVIVVVVLMAVFGGGLGGMFGGGSGAVGGAGGGTSGAVKTGAAACTQSDTHRFACNVNGSTERVWTALFEQAGQRYQPPTLKFFSQATASGCGAAQSAMGPFYCPSDQGIYIDLTFFDELSNRFGAAGDFAGAYVIAHEAGHHIQTISGTSNRIRTAQGGASEAQSNALQVRMELQADCLAGVWAANVNRSGDTLDADDMAEGLRAAEAIGDDTLQRSAGRRPMPESFTHGTSAQRQEALRRGFQGGTLQSCAGFTQGI
jgi:predicted metalloprotease